MPGKPTGEPWKEARSCCKLSQKNHIDKVFLDTKLKSCSFLKKKKEEKFTDIVMVQNHRVAAA